MSGAPTATPRSGRTTGRSVRSGSGRLTVRPRRAGEPPPPLRPDYPPVGPHRRQLLAELDGHLVGVLDAIVAEDEADVVDLFVDPAHRRRGVATALLRTLLRDHPRVTLEVAATNHAALRLYRAVGMVPVGRRPGYYPDGTDAVVMASEDR